jgi:hypothetical protein
MESLSKDKARAKWLSITSKLTPAEWDLIHAYQNYVCFICQKKQKSGKRLATDHRHRSGLISGLLCSHCNRLLGRIEGFGWTIDCLRRTIEYILDPPASRALGRDVYGYPGRWGTKKHRALVKREAKKALKQ